MSAIFGLISHQGGGPPDRALRQMRSALAAHGGDGSSTWTGDGRGLGLELKRVTPEDLAERQPLISRDGQRVLVSDGRIDNRRELAAELGLAWESLQVPDSAFILAAYERWGEDCAARLVGSFSFAIWDEHCQRLLLARSPFGAKTVFYHAAAEFVAFATMPKALFSLAGVPRRLNLQGIADLLILVPPEPGASLYEGISALEPGHLLTADRRGCRVRRFWAPELRRELRLSSDQEYVDAFTELFDRVVADQLRSLSPVGLLLSAGLDSTSVAATAAPLLDKRGERLTAFTGAPMIGFREPDLPGWLLDEAPLAGQVAARFRNVDHLVVRAPGVFLNDLDRFFDVAETPYTGTASRVWYEGIMAAAQRRDISVLLTGKCGNYTVSWPGTGLIRSLVGKGRSRQAWREARAQAPAGGVKSTARIFARGGLVARLPGHVQLAITGHHYDDPLLSPGDWWSPLSPIHPEFAREQRVGERSRARACDRWLMRRVDTPAARLRHLMDDVHHVSGINGAYSALYGVDVRDPTGDARIAQFCLSLPEAQCSRQGTTRSLIRRAMAGRLPAEIVTGSRHGIDTADWFERLSDARDVVQEELRLLDRSETARAVLDLPRLRGLADTLGSPPADAYQRLLDYRNVLERGLMAGRFLRWFEDGHSAF
ncbi:MAG TPA: asparagine synthase-related protein [Trebonia sp.]|nr:asparagine synthase-related protein [Trebonia sp.]